MTKKRTLIIFAREPRLGKVKTRLATELSKETVLKIYQAFVADVLAMAHNVVCDQRFIFYAGHPAHLHFLNQFNDRFTLKRQTGSDLGERMARAFAFVHRSGFDQTIIIGTDCLSMTAQDINFAFDQLNDHDGVIGPAEDGGYYLIGLNEPSPAFFANIAWSTSKVFLQTMKNATAMKKKFFCLETREDIDTLRCLKRLISDERVMNGLENTREVVQTVERDLGYKLYTFG